MSELVCETDQCGIKFTVDYDYSPAEPQEYGYPGCSESICFTTSIDIKDLVLADAWACGPSWTVEELNKACRDLNTYIEEECFRDVKESKEAYEDGLADAQYEAMKDRRMGL